MLLTDSLLIHSKFFKCTGNFLGHSPADFLVIILPQQPLTNPIIDLFASIVQTESFGALKEIK